VDTLAGGESFDQLLGTVDLRDGRRRLTAIRARDEGPTVLAVVPDRRGGVAYLQDTFDDGAQRIGYAPVRPGGGLGVPRPRARVTGSRVVPGSLAVSGGAITWTTRSGQRGAVSANSKSACLVVAMNSRTASSLSSLTEGTVPAEPDGTARTRRSYPARAEHRD
jgi:hypothetical protein